MNLYKTLLPALLGLVLTTTAMASDVTLDVEFRAIGSYVFSFVPLADGKILAGGSLSNAGGANRYNLGRLNHDGRIDESFPAEVRGGPVYCMAVQPDGKILLGGFMTLVNGQSRYSIARLNADGTLDTNFNARSDGYISSLGLQPDGKIIVGGNFSTLCRQPCNYLGRLNADGTFDSSFTSGANQAVYALALQPDGKILVGGYFTNLSGGNRRYIGRLHPNGSLDYGFNPGADGTVRCLALQRNGQIVVGGLFDTLAGQTRNSIGRLNSDGSLDTTFNPGANNSVESLVLQVDGRILVGGNFSTLGGQAHNKVGRLHSDGTIDNGFDVGVGGWVYSVAIEENGDILLGGPEVLARLINFDAPSETLIWNGTNISWMRAGPGPEVWRTSFEYADGANWVSLGAGTPISGGWQIAAGALPTNATIRARGYTSSSYFSGSSWILDQVIGPIHVFRQPLDCTNASGQNVTLSVDAAGAPPLQYQWFKNGAPLEDGVTLNGATTASLQLLALSTEDAGNYQVVISNPSESITSAVARVVVLETVIPLEIWGQYYNQTNHHWGFLYHGPTNQVVVIEESPDLKTWTALQTNLLGTISLAFTNTAPLSHTNGFYRLKLLP